MIDINNGINKCSPNISGENNWLELRGGMRGYCIHVIGLVNRLKEMKWPVFGAESEEETVLMSSLTASELFESINTGLRYDILHPLNVSNNPYLICFFKLLNEIKDHFNVQKLEHVSKESLLNFSVQLLKSEFTKKEIRLLNYKQEKAYRGRLKSTYKYIDSLRSSFSRILCVRVDFSYRKGRFIESANFGDQMRSLKDDWKNMQSILRSSDAGADMIGYVLKLEYGLLKGFHYHALIIYDGSKRQQDIVLGKMLGECWVNDVVASNDGRYYNCNRVKKRYKKLGIGAIDYDDGDKYRNLLDLVLSYMLKPDDVLDFIGLNERLFFKGTIKKTSSSRLGRPRKKSINY